jgi:hypothetical protein
MHRYFETLHEKSDTHKKRFALVVAGSISLFIFTIWSFVNFGSGATLAQDESQERRENYQGSDLSNGFSAAWKSLRSNYGEVEYGLEQVPPRY